MSPRAAGTNGRRLAVDIAVAEKKPLCGVSLLYVAKHVAVLPVCSHVAYLVLMTLLIGRVRAVWIYNLLLLSPIYIRYHVRVYEQTFHMYGGPKAA